MIHSRTIALMVTGTVLATGGLVVSGCGGSGPSGSPSTQASTAPNGVGALAATEILARATAAVDAAQSVKIDGKALGGDDLVSSLRLTATRSGEGSGDLTLAGERLDLVNTGGRTYIKAPLALWTKSGMPASAARLLADRWFTAPASGSDVATIRGLDQATDMAKVVDPVLAEFGEPTKGGTGSVAGRSVITITKADGSTLYVSVLGDPYPLRYVDRSDSPGDVLYADWNAPVSVSAPEDAADLGTITSG